MEWKEISCPGCGEKMQAPGNRASILCMFCGRKIFLDGEKGGQPFSPAEFSAQAREVFDGCESWMERFSYEKYPQAFQEFCRDFAPFFEEVEKGIERQEGSTAGDIMIEQADALLKEIPSKNMLRQARYRLNSFVAVYLFPAILYMGGDEARSFCLEVAQKWGTAFSDSQIRVADYDTIYSGFKRKLCYITTAVCRALDKGEDCPEVIRLKEYRDSFLLQQPEGEGLIKEYYNIAPTIVKRIEKSEDAKERYLEIWRAFLKPCLEDLEQDRKAECGERYREMVVNLMKEYVKDWNGDG